MVAHGPDAIRWLAQANADSVFAYIKRAGEPVPKGIRWQTLNFDNAPQYDASLNNGVAGIGLFLTDYYAATGNSEARDMALGALQWCLGQGEAIDGDSLCLGRAGVGLAWLRYGQITGQQKALEKARRLGDHLAKSALGPVTDFFGGAAGIGVFLLRLGEAAENSRYLEAAAKIGRWLDRVATRDEIGTHWPIILDDPRFTSPHLGFEGLAGIGHFFLLLYEKTADSRWAHLGRSVLTTLSHLSIPQQGGINWPEQAQGDTVKCQWCHGAPGIGLFFLQAYRIFADPALLVTAAAAGEATYALGDIRHNPSQCHGLSGNAELFIELYAASGDPIWLQRSHDFAVLASAYRQETEDGDIWQADEPGCYSPDFLCGAAGTGHFFLRLAYPDRIEMPLCSPR
ncbi:MAG: hypothetical protein GKR89_25920 [Candidatus Latescibacteria bacterium]|nr:hypothetical protein [Candidatus Latescibacterota bacterium]